jgi:hypothetical protein
MSRSVCRSGTPSSQPRAAARSLTDLIRLGGLGEERVALICSQDASGSVHPRPLPPRPRSPHGNGIRSSDDPQGSPVLNALWLLRPCRSVRCGARVTGPGLVARRLPQPIGCQALGGFRLGRLPWRWTGPAGHQRLSATYLPRWLPEPGHRQRHGRPTTTAGADSQTLSDRRGGPVDSRGRKQREQCPLP